MMWLRRAMGMQDMEQPQPVRRQTTDIEARFRPPVSPIENNPVGWSSTYAPEVASNASPDFSPLASSGMMTPEQKLGRFFNVATKQAKPAYTNADLPQLTAAGSEGFDAAMGWAGMTTPTAKGARYVRRSQSDTSPFNSGSDGMAMFVETNDPRGKLEQLASYGPAAWISRGQHAVPVSEIQPAIVRALREGGYHTDYGTTAAQLAREANPTNIVNSAGLWDNPTLVQAIWDTVLEPRGITSVKTSDGLLIFDPSHARRVNRRQP